MECNYRICSFCKGVNHTPEYKLKAANFFALRVELIRGANAAAPMGMPPMQTDPQNKIYSATICKECFDSQNNPVTPLLTVMETAKTNDADTAAIINA